MNVEGLIVGVSLVLIFAGILGTCGAAAFALVDSRWPKWGWLTLSFALVGAAALGAVS